MVRTFLSSLNLNYERLYCKYLYDYYFKSGILTISSTDIFLTCQGTKYIKASASSNNAIQSNMKRKKKCIPTKVAFFDDNMLFFMQNSIARYVRWIM